MYICRMQYHVPINFPPFIVSCFCSLGIYDWNSVINSNRIIYDLFLCVCYLIHSCFLRFITDIRSCMFSRIYASKEDTCFVEEKYSYTLLQMEPISHWSWLMDMFGIFLFELIVFGIFI